MSNTTKYLDEHFIAALKIFSCDPPNLPAIFLYKLYKNHADELIRSGALKKTAYLEEVYVDVGHKMAFREVIPIDGVPCYLSKAGYWEAVDEFDLRVYTSVVDWILRKILYGLGACKEHRYNCILDRFIWSFGNIYLMQHKIPVIIVRCVTDTEVYSTLVQYLNKYHTETPALVLGIERRLPIYFSLAGAILGKSVFIDMNDIIVNELGKVHFNKDFILEKMGKDVKQEGFSDGYRSAYFNGIDYVFTKIQAEVLELLYTTGKRMHQDEIMSRITTNSSNTRLVSLFQSKGKMHPAWGALIKHDSKGSYYLDLSPQ